MLAGCRNIAVGNQASRNIAIGDMVIGNMTIAIGSSIPIEMFSEKTIEETHGITFVGHIEVSRGSFIWAQNIVKLNILLYGDPYSIIYDRVSEDWYYPTVYMNWPARHVLDHLLCKYEQKEKIKLAKKIHIIERHFVGDVYWHIVRLVIRC